MKRIFLESMIKESDSNEMGIFCNSSMIQKTINKTSGESFATRRESLWNNSCINRIPTPVEWWRQIMIISVEFKSVGYFIVYCYEQRYILPIIYNTQILIIQVEEMRSTPVIHQTSRLNIQAFFHLHNGQTSRRCPIGTYQGCR